MIHVAKICIPNRCVDTCVWNSLRLCWTPCMEIFKIICLRAKKTTPKTTENGNELFSKFETNLTFFLLPLCFFLWHMISRLSISSVLILNDIFVFIIFNHIVCNTYEFILCIDLEVVEFIIWMINIIFLNSNIKKEYMLDTSVDNFTVTFFSDTMFAGANISSYHGHCCLQL